MNNTMPEDGSDKDVTPSKVVKRDLAKAITTSKKIKVMEDYFKSAIPKKDRSNPGWIRYSLKEYNKDFKEYNSDMKRKGLKNELNIARKKLFKKYWASI